MKKLERDEMKNLKGGQQEYDDSCKKRHETCSLTTNNYCCSSLFCLTVNGSSTCQ